MRSKSEFRVLLVYPDLALMMTPSLAMALFASILKREGFLVALFDTTHYVGDEPSLSEIRYKTLQVRSFSPEELGIVPRPASCLLSDFRTTVETFRPDVMMFSVVENTFEQAVAMLDAVRDLNVPALLGGVFAMAAPDVMLSYDQVKAVCIGEGEYVVREFANRVYGGRPVDDIPGVWVKQPKGEIVRNRPAPLVDINETLPDFSLVARNKFNRAMGGRVFRMVPIEFYRGCPYSCTFCNSPMKTRQAREYGLGIFPRRKSVTRLRVEIQHLMETVEPEYLLFVDDTFLARPRAELDAFGEMYREFRIPFWLNTRSETLEARLLSGLRAVGCDRLAFGIECGNEEFRARHIGRGISNEKIIRASEIVAETGIPYSVNVIIGFPHETRALIFETIELCRALKNPDNITVHIFTPYYGTEMREMSVAAGYMEPSVLTRHNRASSELRMPQLSAQEIDGLLRTFNMYVYFEKSWWPEIEVAEKLTAEGDAAFSRLARIFTERFLSRPQRAGAAGGRG